MQKKNKFPLITAIQSLQSNSNFDKDTSKKKRESRQGASSKTIKKIYEMKPCPKCCESMSSDALPSHFKACSPPKISCPKCSLFIFPGDMAEHTAFCQKNFVEQNNNERGQELEEENETYGKF